MDTVRPEILLLLHRADAVTRQAIDARPVSVLEGSPRLLILGGATADLDALVTALGPLRATVIASEGALAHHNLDSSERLFARAWLARQATPAKVRPRDGVAWDAEGGDAP